MLDGDKVGNRLRGRAPSIERRVARASLVGDWGQDLGSKHWKVTVLETDQSNTKFIVRRVMAAHEVTAADNGGWQKLHAGHYPQQNLDRVKLGEKAAAIIARRGHNHVRVADTAIYPLNGDYESLRRGSLADEDVVIIQEFVETGQPIKALSEAAYDQIVALAYEGSIPDLNPGNVIIELASTVRKAVLVDLESPHAGPMIKQLPMANFARRMFLEHQIAHFEAGGARIGVGCLGLANQNPDIKFKKGVPLCAVGALQVMYAQDPVAFVVSNGLVYVVAPVLFWRSVYYHVVISRLFNKCHKAVLKKSEELAAHNVKITESLLRDEVMLVLKALCPKENRKEIIESFATSALASLAKNQYYKARIQLRNA